MSISGSDRDGDQWLENELSGSTLPDQRLARRLQQIVGRMVASPGRPLSFACQDGFFDKALSPQGMEIGMLKSVC